MTSNIVNCVYCNKECKNSDSRPYPNSKGKEKIHNKCQIKKNLTEKNNKNHDSASHNNSKKIDDSKSSNDMANSSVSISVLERITKEEEDLRKIENEKKLTKLVQSQSKKSNDSSSSKSLFFDLKAGIAKSHEKKRFLHHRKLSDIVTRYNDDGFHEEAIGRAFDHTGKDLNTLGVNDDSNDNDSEKQRGKRKLNLTDIDNSDKLAKRKSRIKIDEQNPCWFCLSSPKVERDLIKNIGEHCYISLPKGGLTDDHLLILPIEHIECLNDSKANSKDLLNELEEFKNSLVKSFELKGKAVVFFERNFKSVHWQIQVIPIPMKKLATIENNIKTISKRHFKNSDYHDIPKNFLISDVVPPGLPYLYWQIEPKGTKFVSKIEIKGSFFPVQLPRLILADELILNCPERVNWRDCVTK